MVTKHLKEHVADGTHGALQKVVIGLKYWIDVLQQVQVKLANNIDTNHLNICVGFVIKKLEEYLGKINRLAIYIAILVLYPWYEWENLGALWSGHKVKRSLYQASKTRVQYLWYASYKNKVVLVEGLFLLRDNPDSDNDDVFHKFMHT